MSGNTIRADMLLPADGLASSGRLAGHMHVAVIGFLDLCAARRAGLGQAPLQRWPESVGVRCDDDAPQVALVRRWLSNGDAHVHAIPWAGHPGEAFPGTWAASGRWLHSRDERFTIFCGHRQPVALHDYDLRLEKR